MQNDLFQTKDFHISPLNQRDFLKRLEPMLLMHEELQTALSVVSDYITHFVTHLKSGSGMVWMGKQKTPKSILAIYLAHALLEAGFSIRHELNLQFLKSILRSPDALEDCYPYAEHAQLLLIDDGGFSADSLTAPQKDALKHIISIRRQKQLPLIWMTQFSQESLPRFLGEEIAQDLLHPHNRIFHFDWDHSYYFGEKKSCLF